MGSPGALNDRAASRIVAVTSAVLRARRSMSLGAESPRGHVWSILPLVTEQIVGKP